METFCFLVILGMVLGTGSLLLLANDDDYEYTHTSRNPKYKPYLKIDDSHLKYVHNSTNNRVHLSRMLIGYRYIAHTYGEEYGAGHYIRINTKDLTLKITDVADEQYMIYVTDITKIKKEIRRLKVLNITK